MAMYFVVLGRMNRPAALPSPCLDRCLFIARERYDFFIAHFPQLSSTFANFPIFSYIYPNLPQTSLLHRSFNVP